MIQGRLSGGQRHLGSVKLSYCHSAQVRESAGRGSSPPQVTQALAATETLRIMTMYCDESLRMILGSKDKRGMRDRANNQLKKPLSGRPLAPPLKLINSPPQADPRHHSERRCETIKLQHLKPV